MQSAIPPSIEIMEMEKSLAKLAPFADVLVSMAKGQLQARAALAATPAADAMDESREDLFWKLHSLSKSLESSGRIDQHDQPEAYTAILNAMTLVRQGAAAAPVELRGFLVAVAAGSMSRNNQEQMAAELLHQLDTQGMWTAGVSAPEAQTDDPAAGFEMWWAEHMPEATQAQAFMSWSALKAQPCS